MIAPIHYPWLDVARGLSALLVVVGHCRAAFFPPLSTIASPSIIEIGFYAATSLGRQAVMAFFVLSGFLVGGSVIRAGQRFRFRDYMIARLCRLWVVLIPALMFAWAVDVVIAVTAPHALHGAFSAQWNSGPHTDVPYSRSLTTFLGNIAFVQTAWVPAYRTNGPVWSLFCEFWCYVIFPLLMTGLAPRSRFSLPFAAVVAVEYDRQPHIGSFGQIFVARRVARRFGSCCLLGSLWGEHGFESARPVSEFSIGSGCFFRDVWFRVEPRLFFLQPIMV